MERRGAAGGRVIEAELDGAASPPARSPEDGFRSFVAARWVALTRYAFLLTGDHQAAEDVVQTALEKCWPRWGQIAGGSPEAYVRVAIARTAISRGRRRRHHESSFEDLRARSPEVVAALAAPGDVAEEQALRIGLWLALAELPPRRRAVVVLRLLEDRSEGQTAKALGISAGAVKSQLSKGLAQLRRSPHARELIGTRLEGER